MTRARTSDDDCREKILSRISVDENGCWNWTRYIDSAGYGRITVNMRVIRAHILSYRVFVGDIPNGLELDHLCRNRKCCNPDHLEAVTRKVNLLRGEAPSAKNARKTHCVNGHEFTAANTTIDKTGSRQCNACQKIRSLKNRRTIEEMREYRAANVERIRKLDRERYQRNRQSKLDSSRKYYLAHIDNRKSYDREYWKKRKHKVEIDKLRKGE